MDKTISASKGYTRQSYDIMPLIVRHGCNCGFHFILRHWLWALMKGAMSIGIAPVMPGVLRAIADFS